MLLAINWLSRVNELLTGRSMYLVGQVGSWVKE